VRRNGRRTLGARLTAILVSAILVGLAACSTGGLQPVRPIGVDAGHAASLVSAYRAANGLGPVGVDSRLMQAASDYARAMGERDKINHRIGGSLAKRVARAGYDWGATAENLGAGYPTLDAAMDAWKGSPGHRRNLLNPLITEIGIAAVATPAGARHDNYWALILAGPRLERAPSGPFAMGPPQ
jgi:hypothetical protein